jgi:hypothetical protein
LCRRSSDVQLPMERVSFAFHTTQLVHTPSNVSNEERTST